MVGCLQHGAGVCDEQSTGSPLLVELKARSLASSREDENFDDALRHSATVKTGEFPPAALVELYHEPGAVAARLRRLHLVIVDLCHPRKTATKIEKKFYQQITRVRDTEAVSITPIPLWNHEEWRCRYVFGYSLDDSDKPTLCVVCEGSGRCEALQINTSQMKSHSNGKMRKVKRHDTTN